MESTLSILGDSYQILHDPLRVSGIFEGENVLYVGGKSMPEMHGLKRFFVPWIKKRAHHFFVDYAHQYASQLGCRFQGVTIRETISRWGSCSSNGRLSFNWRLLLAPEAVAHYVCVHEVCHLKEMNHSPAFWDLVEKLHPTYKEQRLWLKKYGKSLYTLFPLNKEKEKGDDDTENEARKPLIPSLIFK
jgi:predicted metal-dependent hydrolase